VKAKVPPLRLPVSLARSSRCGPGEFAASLASWEWSCASCSFETTAFYVGVDPARITLSAGQLLPGASCDRDEQVTDSAEPLLGLVR
jgi:hypothetical protein